MKPIDFISDRALLLMVFITIFAVVGWIVYSAHKDAPKLHKECEKAGGVLIEARSPLYTCVMPVATGPKKDAK